MSIIIRIKNFIDELEQKQLIQYFLLGCLSCALVVGLLFYYHKSAIKNLHQELRRINHQRAQARELLEKYATVKQQKISVDEILLQDKTFKIKEYFSRTLTEMNLQSKLDKEAEVAEPQDLDNGYTEIKLDASFTAMNMRELSEFLYHIEKNQRVYVKELVINKALQSATIDVALIIATLQPKLET